MWRAGILICALTLAGCASIARGTTDQVAFESTPQGATVRTAYEAGCGGFPCQNTNEAGGTYSPQEPLPPEPGAACVTPCVLTIGKNKRVIATFTKDGYHPEVIRITPEVAGAGVAGVAGNLILGGGIGIITDTATGAANDLRPNPAVAVLRPIMEAPQPAPAKPPVRRR